LHNIEAVQAKHEGDGLRQVKTVLCQKPLDLLPQSPFASSSPMPHSS
jgi:hypothetical protein